MSSDGWRSQSSTTDADMKNLKQNLNFLKGNAMR